MSILSPTTTRRIALAVLGSVLLLLLVATNALVAADRTVLDADHVVETFEEEDGHVALADSLSETFNDSGGGSGDADGSGGDGSGAGGSQSLDFTAPPSPEPPVDELARDAVTPEWTLTQVDENVHAVYAYLHGERDDLEVAFDLVPVKDRVEAGVEEWVREADLESIDPVLAHMVESESQFREARATFEERQRQRIQRETEEEYTEEELRQIYDDRRRQIRDRLVAELERRVADSGAPEELHDPIVTLGTLRIDGLTQSGLTHDEFVAEVEAARESVAPAVAEGVRTQLDGEINDTENLAAGVGAEQRRTLETARTVVSPVSTLVYLLPVGALGVAALVGRVSTSRSAAFRRVGATSAMAGVFGLVGAVVARRVAPLPEGGAEADAMQAVATALVEDLLAALSVQGGVLLVLGVGLFGVGMAIHREMLPIEDVPGGAAPADGGDPAGGDDATGGDEAVDGPDAAGGGEAADGGGVVTDRDDVAADGDDATDGDDAAEAGNATAAPEATDDAAADDATDADPGDS